MMMMMITMMLDFIPQLFVLNFHVLDRWDYDDN